MSGSEGSTESGARQGSVPDVCKGDREIESEFDASNAWKKWTFSVATPLINKGFTSPVLFDDLLRLPKHDQPGLLIECLKRNYDKCKSGFILPRLFVAMFASHKRELCYMIFYTLLEGATKIALPLTLKSLLRSLQHEVGAFNY
jgi:hypothetical protein